MSPLRWGPLLLALWPRRAPPPPPPPPPQPPPAHLSLARVDVEFSGQTAKITAELTFTRGAHTQGNLDAFVAYGAPGIPRTFEARVVPVEPGHLLPSAASEGAPAQARHALHAPPESAFAVGPRSSAGQHVTIAEADLDRALAPSGLAALRLRWTHDLGAHPGAARTVLVRATSSGATLPLGALSARGAPASASLCGARSLPLALSGQPARPPLLSPPLLPPGPGADLCFRAPASD